MALYKYANDLLPIKLKFQSFYSPFDKGFRIHMYIYLSIMILQVHLFKS